MDYPDRSAQEVLDELLSNYATADAAPEALDFSRHPLLADGGNGHPPVHVALIYDLPRQRTLAASPGLQTLLDVDPAEWAGQHMDRMHERVYAPDQLRNAQLIQAARSQLGVELFTPMCPEIMLTFRFVHRSGDPVWVQAITHALQLDSVRRLPVVVLALVTPTTPTPDGLSQLSVRLADQVPPRWVPIRLDGQGGALSPEFSARELSVIRLLAQGKTSREIAQVLDTHTEAVNKLRKRLLELTRTRNSADLVRFAVERGLI